MNTASSRKSVAIIGAGISGVSCARVLVRQNFDVHLFEKARGIGGRIATRRALNNQLHFNHGAQYFTARSEQFVQSVQELVNQGVVQKLDSDKIKVIEASGDKYIVTNPSDSSANTVRYVGKPGNSAIVKALASEIESDHIHLQTRVQKLTKDNNGRWLLEIDNGSTYSPAFDYVVISAPVEQTVKLLKDSQSENANFAKLIGEASKASLKPCWALMCAFKRKTSLSFDSSFVNNHKSISWITKSVTSEVTNLESWVVHASADWSQTHLEDDVETVQRQLYSDFLELLSKTVGSDYVEHASQPEYISAHRWRFAIPSPALEQGYLYDEDSRVSCIGDWVSSSRVEGAFNSGYDVSQRIIAVSKL